MLATDAIEDDVFQDVSSSVIDCDVLEAAKENIQPLASGRRVTALSAIFTTPHAQREAQLNATRSRFRINVQIALEDEDGDPLEAYCHFVYWTVENYPQGHSAESGLLELLEEATRVLKDDRCGMWRGDVKYLKLWVLYASYVEKPAVIYSFLVANDIGTDHALLYEEFATVLERDGRRTHADETYLLGIARQADPVERLRNKHREFQKRMLSAAPTADVPSAPGPPASKRKVLGSSSSPITTTPAPSSGFSSRSAAPFTNDVFSAPAARPQSNGRLQVFVDPSGSESQSTPTSWPELGTRKTRVKENVPGLSKAGGTTLKQPGRPRRTASSSTAPVSVSRIVPYRDPNPEDAGITEMPPPPLPASKKRAADGKTPVKPSITPFRDGDIEEVPATPKFMPFRDEDAVVTPAATTGVAPGTIMKVKKSGARGPGVTSEAEALRKDPFKNYDAADRPVDIDG